MRLAITPGQESSSDSSMADQWRASSETGRSFGRARAGFWRMAWISWSSQIFYTGMTARPFAGRWSFGSVRDCTCSSVASGANSPKHQALRRDVDEREFCDDVIDYFDAGERQGALLQDFGLVVAGGVFHGDEDALGTRDEVHRAAHAFQHFAGDGPVGKRALFIHLQRAEDGEVT